MEPPENPTAGTLHSKDAKSVLRMRLRRVWRELPQNSLLHLAREAA